VADYPETVVTAVPDARVPDAHGSTLLGEIADTEAPTIGGWSPSPGSQISATQPLTVDVVDDTGAFRRILVVVAFPSAGVEEGAHNGDGFTAVYQVGSSRSLIVGGYRYVLSRLGGWPSAPTVTIYAFDLGGNEGV
jgi:hypothetical protein